MKIGCVSLLLAGLLALPAAAEDAVPDVEKQDSLRRAWRSQAGTEAMLEAVYCLGEQCVVAAVPGTATLARCANDGWLIASAWQRSQEDLADHELASVHCTTGERG